MRANVRHAEACPECAGSGMDGRKPITVARPPISASDAKTVEDWRENAHQERIKMIHDEVLALRREFEEWRDKIGVRKK